eukprot:s2459_g17.t1
MSPFRFCESNYFSTKLQPSNLADRGYSNYDNGETFPLVAAFSLYNLSQPPRRSHVLLDVRPNARAPMLPESFENTSGSDDQPDMTIYTGFSSDWWFQPI